MQLAHITTPFILLDDARQDGAADARLFREPLDIRKAQDHDGVDALLEWLNELGLKKGLAAGYLGYGAGAALDKGTALQSIATDVPPVGWFAQFTKVERIKSDNVPDLLPSADGAWSSAAEPHISRAQYEEAIATVLNYIHAGDIYQANLTFQATVNFGGHPLALYARLRERQQAGYGGIIYTGKHWILSFSPELFFSQRGASIMARPMKGTALRDTNPVRDTANASALSTDPKQRAENLMIVDLIRNDLSRVAMAGSVTVPDLFHVEHYPTVHQMVSSVHATLKPRCSAVDVIKAAFPCGSITGAPKIRAMDIITEVETEPRGVYTGSIGYISGRDDAAFNVAIRTLVIHAAPEGATPSVATLGLGSGIVADSVAGAEWLECLAKGRFVESANAFDLIETMAFDPEGGIARLEKHLARMTASATELGFAFDRHGARNELQAATFRLREPAKIRMMLSRKGNIAIEVGPLPDAPNGPVEVKLMPLPVENHDWRLAHKSTDRTFYDDARKEAGSFEVAFTDPDGALTEGSFTNIFLEKDGALITPPLAQGLLPGVLRETLIEEGRAREGAVTAKDLQGEFYIGNSLRGLLVAKIAI